VKISRATLMQKYGGRCGHCLTRPATDTHEIIPRSRDPAGWDDEQNQIALCRPCHMSIQSDWRKWAPVLQQDRQRAARLFGWKEEQDEPTLE
jgi:5-methylcytosine-specific restriction endonuclease McrA